MTTELTKAAQQALEACPFCGCDMRIESNRDWHKLRGNHAEGCVFSEDAPVMTVPATDCQLEVLVHDWNNRALTQRPAAQDGAKCAMRYTPIWKPGVDGLPYQESNYGCRACGYVGKHDTHPGCKLPAPQQATPEPDDDDKWRDVALRFDKHRMQALWHLNAMLQDPVKHADIVRQFLKDPTHPAAATPEPVGEPAAWRWFNSNGDQVTNWLDFKPSQKANVEAQVAEAGGRIEYAYTRPAPGVPEVK